MISNTGFWIIDDFSEYHQFDPSLAQEIVKLAKYYKIKKIYDFGCGNGDYVDLFIRNNIEAIGFDGNPMTHILNNCKVQDLTVHFQEEPVDFLLCIEVGEHIPKQFEFQFIQNCDIHINPGGILVLSWAIPEQPGLGHVNCQENGYVIDRFKQIGYSYNPEHSSTLRKSSSLLWFKNSIMVFSKGVDL